MERKMCMYSIEHCFAHSICVYATEICVWHWNVEGSVTHKKFQWYAYKYQIWGGKLQTLNCIWTSFQKVWVPLVQESTLHRNRIPQEVVGIRLVVAWFCIALWFLYPLWEESWKLGGCNIRTKHPMVTILFRVKDFLTCIPPSSNLAWFEDLGAILGMYVNSLLNSVFEDVKAVAREAICLSLLALSSVGTNGSILLLFLCMTTERFLRFLTSEKDEVNYLI